MRKWIGRLPALMCGVYGFYPLMCALGKVFGFGYELRSPILCVWIAAGLTLLAVAALLVVRPEYTRAGRIGLTTAIPLGCVYSFLMENMLDHAGLIAVQLCWILLLILYLAHAKKHRAGAVLVAACVFIQLALIPGMLMFCWTNPLAERTQRIHSYDDGQYTYETFEVDEGALGMHWYTEVRSIDKYSLVFGTFYPHYERIQQTSPIFYLQTGPV